MKKKNIFTGLFAMSMIASITGIKSVDTINVSAAPKLTVNRTYENATRIKGQTKKKSCVKVKIGTKTYKKDEPVGSNGFHVKIYKASDTGKNAETEQHKHTFTQPIYAKVHHEEIGHMETVTDPPTYHDEKCEHVICQDCGKDLTQAYIEGIKSRYLLGINVVVENGN